MLAGLTDEKLIEKVKEAYRLIGRIPSRGLRDTDDVYACAWHVLVEADPNAVGNMSPDWVRGFNHGFEWTEGRMRGDSVARGMKAGLVVAEAIFSWAEAPNISHPKLVERRTLQEQVQSLSREVSELRKQMNVK